MGDWVFMCNKIAKSCIKLALYLKRHTHTLSYTQQNISKLSFACFKMSLLCKLFIWKWVWFAWKWAYRENTFSKEWFWTRICFDTEEKDNLEVVYLVCACVWEGRAITCYNTLIRLVSYTAKPCFHGQTVNVIMNKFPKQQRWKNRGKLH